MRLATTAAHIEHACTFITTFPFVTLIARRSAGYCELARGLAGGATTEHLAIETSPKIANIGGAFVTIVALRVTDTATLHRSVVTFIQCVAEVIGAWVPVIAVPSRRATRWNIDLSTGVVGRETDCFSTIVVVSRAL